MICQDDTIIVRVWMVHISFPLITFSCLCMAVIQISNGVYVVLCMVFFIVVVVVFFKLKSILISSCSCTCFSIKSLCQCLSNDSCRCIHSLLQTHCRCNADALHCIADAVCIAVCIALQMQVHTVTCVTKTYTPLFAGSTHTRSTASNLEQVANLLCSQANSTSYPQWDRKWVVAHLLWATRWRPTVADWGIGVSAACTVGLIVH